MNHTGDAPRSQDRLKRGPALGRPPGGLGVARQLGPGWQALVASGASSVAQVLVAPLYPANGPVAKGMMGFCVGYAWPG